MDKIKITKENYRGYIDLYKHYMNLDLPKSKIMLTFLVSILLWIIFSTIISLINPIGLYFIICGSIIICCNAISSVVINRIKTKKELKKKYPFLDYNIKQKELAELLTKNNLLQHNEETNTYYIYKSGELKLLEEQENKVEQKNKTNKKINYYHQNLLVNNQEQAKVKKLNYKR